jgi:peroxiredoxin (alkyl hydroperoxide reductase subunit C)
VSIGGFGNVQYPVIADLVYSIGGAYDVLIGAEPATVLGDEADIATTVGGGVALRGSFLIDEEGTVRHAVINDLPLGRNIDEMLRMVDALDFHTKNGEVCPAGWTEGDDGMKDTSEGVASYLTDHADEL